MRNWIFAITAAAFISAICRAAAPKGSVKRVVMLICGMITVIALISPVADLDKLDLSGSIARMRQYAVDTSDDFEQINDNLRREIIEQDCAAYILDKAGQLGIDNISVSVTAKWSEDGYWYPVSAQISATAPQTLKDKLTLCIEAELGIAEDEQIWSDEYDGQ
jgi:hypothetical protein